MELQEDKSITMMRKSQDQEHITHQRNLLHKMLLTLALELLPKLIKTKLQNELFLVQAHMINQNDQILQEPQLMGLELTPEESLTTMELQDRQLTRFLSKSSMSPNT